MLLSVKQLQTANIGPLSFNLNSGERLFIHGPSGAGKSLLLRALADLDEQQGDIQLAGINRQDISATEWRRRVAYLPTTSHWWQPTIGQHFDKIEATYFQQLGFTLEVLNWQVSRCSSGELQRLALLRLLQNQPEILLLDEATANLDQENRQRIERLMLDYQQQHAASLIWVSHDQEQIQRLAQQVLAMKNGRWVTDDD